MSWSCFCSSILDSIISGGTPTSSSSYLDDAGLHGAHFATDLKLAFGFAFIAHTKDENYPWMQVEFSSEQTVTGVAIVNRADGAGFRLKDAAVTVGNSAMSVGQQSTNPICSEFTGPSTDGALHVFLCHPPLAGKLVIFQQTSGFLQVNEMIVFGDPGNINFLTLQKLPPHAVPSFIFLGPFPSLGKPPVCKGY